MPKAVVFDIDGTLSRVGDRVDYLCSGKKDFDKFNSEMLLDDPNDEIIGLTKLYKSAGWVVLIFTGRPEEYRTVTEKWLFKHSVSFDRLEMRPPEKRFEPDFELKESMLKCARENIVIAIEDRNRVVKMWRKNGIICLQCAEGDF